MADDKPLGVARVAVQNAVNVLVEGSEEEYPVATTVEAVLAVEGGEAIRKLTWDPADDNKFKPTGVTLTKLAQGKNTLGAGLYRIIHAKPHKGPTGPDALSKYNVCDRYSHADITFSLGFSFFGATDVGMFCACLLACCGGLGLQVRNAKRRNYLCCTFS
jgi:hypothetical protein